MSVTSTILSVLAPVGAIDVIYYHLYRQRLYLRYESIAEMIVHLLRQGTFLAIVLLLSIAVEDPRAQSAILVLLLVDFASSATDVLLEPKSRASIGGLPPFEYFLHFLGTFGAGLAATAFWFERNTIEPMPLLQSVPMLIGGAVLLLFEGALFVRARLRARLNEPTPAYTT